MLLACFRLAPLSHQSLPYSDTPGSWIRGALPMTGLDRSGRRPLIGVMTIGILTGAGCGDDDGIGRRHPVAGAVTSGGRPVERGTITFVPKAREGRHACGHIADGSY